MCLFPGPLIFTPSQRVGNRVRTGSQGSVLPVIFFLPLSSFSLHTAHGIMPSDPMELLPFLFLAGSFLFMFLPSYLLQGGSGSLLLFLMSCQLESHIAHRKLRGRDYSSPGWPGGGLQICNHGALVVQLHCDHWGMSGLDMSACVSFPLLRPPYGW